MYRERSAMKARKVRGHWFSAADALPKILNLFVLLYSIITLIITMVAVDKLDLHSLLLVVNDAPILEANLGGRNCTYEGNCPSLSFCGRSGRCIPYIKAQQIESLSPYPMNVSSNSAGQTAFSSTCVQKCILDADWDERYYFISTANIFGEAIEHKAFNAEGPDGCIIFYKRSVSHEHQPTTIEWKKNRSGNLVRRDPVPEKPGTPGEEQRWAVLCYNDCGSDEACQGSGQQINLISSTNTDLASFHCSDSSRHCERRNKQKQSNYEFGRDDIVDYKNGITNNNQTAQPSDLVVLSYAGESYFRGLSELAASLRYWAPHARLVVYNLGLREESMKLMDQWSNLLAIHWREGFPDSIPMHARVGKVYAWKPIALAEAVQRYGKILMFDGGTCIRGPLDPLERILEQTGNFVAWGQDADMMQKSHPKSFEWFNYSKDEFIGGPSFGGGTQGYLYPSEAYGRVVRPMLSCAMNASCIQPVGSGLSNHRYDQTVLSILSYQYHVMLQPHTEYLAASNPGKKFRQPVEKRVWTARQGSRNYQSSGY